MALDEYRRKRDFRRTPEPKGATRRRRASPRFVVQKHAASRLHYDFRLELDGVLKSWAVPKGPSLDPTVKALAVQVEDHPLDYADFEGVIPKGEYGGGTVMLWDQGEWEPVDDPNQGLRDGKLTFVLHGERLRGEWALVRMRSKSGDDRNWLLIKHKDSYVSSKARSDDRDRSVATGRTMEEIAAAGDRVWHSGDAKARRARSRDVKNKSTKPSRNDRGGIDGLDAGSLLRARKARQPAFIQPQLATLVKTPPDGDEWLHELKYDGYRLLCVKQADKVRLLTRRGNNWSARFPTIVEAARRLAVEQAILDGEIVVLDSEGRTSFQALQNLMRSGDTHRVVYYAFDIPHADGFDLTGSPLAQRKELLRRLLEWSGSLDRGPIRYSDHVVGNGPTMFEHASQMAIEGIVSKRADSRYESRRSHSWLKLKCLKRQEFVIGGMTRPEGSRTGFGALLLGYYEDGKLVYCGRVGTGFSVQSLAELTARLKPLATDESPFDTGPTRAEARGARWVRAELVAEVEYSEWTNDDRLRQPSFQGLREDKEPKMVGRERAESIYGASRPKGRRKQRASANALDKPTKALADARGDGPPKVAGVTITNADRVVYPDRDLTKFDVARYYEEVAEWILPGVVERPLTLVRCPQGMAAKCFYQKHIAQTLPPPVRGVDIKESGATEKYVAIDDLPGLITLVQFGALEIHPWSSRIDELEKPDRVIFDLDPAPDVAWKDVVEAAKRVGELLADLGLTSFPRTSGGKGLHVVAPLRRTAEWERVKEFAALVATAMVTRWPNEYIATASKAKRRGKVFVDYLRNSRGATAIASYSTRARAGATVATPIAWDELTTRLNSGAFDVTSVPKRLSRLRSDPWAGFDEARQSISQSVLEAARRAAAEARAR